MKILLGFPTLQDISPPVVASFMRLAAEARTLGEVSVCFTEGLIPYDKGREGIFTAAMEADVDYVLCLDSDMLFPTGTVHKLKEALELSGAQVASGLYVRRGYPYTCVWSKKVDDLWFQVDAESGIHEIDMTGLGCALVDMRWLKEHVRAPFCTFERRYDRADILDDESFFEKVRDAGGKIIGVADVQCSHMLRPEFVDLQTARKLREQSMAETIS